MLVSSVMIVFIQHFYEENKYSALEQTHCAFVACDSN